MYDLTVIIPTLNEAESIRGTVMQVIRILKDNQINGQVLVVDDNSSLDNTIFILNDLKREYENFDFIVRLRDHGLSQSLVDGFNHAKTDIIMVIDSDGQHPVEKIPEVYQGILDGNDISIGSRYMGISGSGFEGLAYHRRLISWGATYLARIIFPAITDSGSGFFAFRKAVIKDAPLKPQGFRMLFEILGKGHWASVKEIPIIFGIRKKGTSKLTTKTITDYLKQLWGLLTYSFSHKDTHGHAELKRLATFMAVGVTGILVYETTLLLMTEIAGIFYIWSGLIGIELSILSNFTLNDIFTFGDIIKKKYSFIQRITTYHLVSLIGTLISLSILVILTESFGIWYILSSLIGILTAFMWNFSVNRGITWSRGTR